MCTNNRYRIFCFLFLLAGSAAWGVSEEVKPFDNVPGWGRVVDPAGDCAFEHNDNTFTIRVPGEGHDLWPLKGKVNAPLVLQEVEGDFTVEVLVRSVEKAEKDTAIPGRASTTAFHSGTLVIWQDAKNFVRLDRTDMNKAGKVITSCYFHIFKDGERVVELSPIVPDRPTNLRLARKDDRLTAAYSQDGGKTWREFPEQTIDLPAKLKTGISALNSTVRSNTVQFEGLKVTK
jgi:regulation of enolase protein 1 (concanavalin A-like superfamily)